MEKLFLHVCCGPCAAYPLEWLRSQRPGMKLELWYYNPNVHPRGEFNRRRDSLAFLAAHHGLAVDFSAPYDARDFLAELGPNPRAPERCRLCYARRFELAAREAAARGHTALASTLAYSRRQKPDLIVEEGRRAAAAHGLDFFYEDWRSGWRRGHEIARELGLYRQNYCGCLFSELER
ncbi:MAG: epoxyqueuosine reductase QueH [Candidatus Adiutrix sp.]|jgi:predicted adenine nucleotide alpha hydrolase (AANH) superfamily ATPase|nr:epoxyqueuosine reductase QueH [Candidatus Adiutrix sp.]